MEYSFATETVVFSWIWAHLWPKTLLYYPSSSLWNWTSWCLPFILITLNQRINQLVCLVLVFVFFLIQNDFWCATTPPSESSDCYLSFSSLTDNWCLISEFDSSTFIILANFVLVMKGEISWIMDKKHPSPTFKTSKTNHLQQVGHILLEHTGNLPQERK